MKINGIESSSSIEKTIAVFKQLCKEPYTFKISELARLTDINRTTLYRIMNTLESHGLVIKTESDKAYKLGPMAYQMGAVYLNSFKFNDKIFPILDKISHESQESVGIAVREGDRVISLYEIEIEQPLRMNYKPGLLYPMNRGCYGKCLMAYHDQSRVKKLLEKSNFDKICKNTLTNKEDIIKEYEKIRHQGYVTSDEETFPLAEGVGIPISNSDGKVRTCIAISFLKDKNYKHKMENLKNVLLSYKEEINKYML